MEIAVMSNSHPLRIAAALAVGLIVSLPAVAGPPLICHPFVVGAEPLLPWVEGTRNWHSPDSSYDVRELTADTLELLSADAPILARMENLRRATIYAAENPTVSAELLGAIVARTQGASPGSAAALAWFDAGYLIETYRQFGLVHEHRMLPSGTAFTPMLAGDQAALDGYVLVQKALALAPEKRPEMEFAASLMTRDSAAAAAHRGRAAAAAGADSPLALNLADF